MPDRKILIDKLEESVLTQERLVAEVRSLQVSRRRLEAMIVILFAILLGVGLLANWSLAASRNANDAVKATKTQNALTAQQSAAYNVGACTTRNGAFKAIRDALTAQYQVWEGVLAGSPNGATPQAQDFLAKLRSALPSPDKQDLDCNRDGKLDALDYPQGDVPPS